MPGADGSNAKSLAAAAAALARAADSLAAACGGVAQAGAGAGFHKDCFFYRWEATPGAGIQPLFEPDLPRLDSLLEMDAPREMLRRNLARFAKGRAANHALITGPRGCGKSSLARACIAQVAAAKLRVLETDAAGLARLPILDAQLPPRAGRFIVFCDDITAPADTADFARLKSVLEGGLSGGARRFLLVATANRRRLTRDTFAENESPLADSLQNEAEEIHPAESVEEKIALADRFGLHLEVEAQEQELYLKIVEQAMRELGVKPGARWRQQAAAWAIARGGRNGRAAQQFAIFTAAQK